MALHKFHSSQVPLWFLSFFTHPFWETLFSKEIWCIVKKGSRIAFLWWRMETDCYPSVNQQFESGILLLTNTITAGRIQIIADPLFSFQHAASEYAVCTRLGDSHYLPYEHHGLGISIAALPSYRGDSLQLLANNVTHWAKLHTTVFWVRK